MFQFSNDRFSGAAGRDASRSDQLLCDRVMTDARQRLFKPGVSGLPVLQTVKNKRLSIIGILRYRNVAHADLPQEQEPRAFVEILQISNSHSF